MVYGLMQLQSINMQWPTFCLRFSKNMHNLCLGRILAQSSDKVPTLSISDLHLIGWCSVKQLESIFEV